MLMEQCAFQVWSWSIFDLLCSSRLLMVQDHMVLDHKLRPKSQKSMPPLAFDKAKSEGGLGDFYT